MAYEDRLRQCVYISPSGAEFTLQFDELKRTGGKKASVHEIPDTNDSDVQDQGNISIRFPLQVYISGQDYDITADSFWEALSERGPGELRHPRFGNFNVQIMTFSQTEQFVDGMSRAVFDLEFVRVADLQYPETTTEAAAEIKQKKITLDSVLAAVYAAGQRLRTLAENNVITDTLNAVNETAGAVLGAVAEVEDAINDSFNTILDSVNSTLSTLLGDPLILAGSYVNLFNTVIAVPGKLREKISGYKTMFDQIFGTPISTPNNSGRNTANLQQLIGAASVASIMESVLYQTYETRDEILFFINEIETITDELIANLDSVGQFFENKNITDSFNAEQDILSLISNIKELTNNYLLAQSFDLAIKRTMITKKEYTPIDLTYELYGTIDQLDFFIETNELKADEYFTIPIGREIVSYG